MSGFEYRGDRARHISFPLGGIGAGSVGIDGQGRFKDFEMGNKPSKNSRNGFTHFLIRAEREGRVLDARVVNGPLQPHFMGDEGGKGNYANYGFGPSRHTLAGVPHFDDCTFAGPFPIARIGFEHSAFPGNVALTAFSPFIPLDDYNSSLPAAFFEIEATNTADEALTYSFMLSVNNPHEQGRINALNKRGKARLLILGTNALDASDPLYGQMCAATDAALGGGQSYWYRGRWFDNLSMFWKDVQTPGAIKNREYPPSAKSGEDIGTLEARFDCAPGQTVKARFVLSWYYPTCVNDWNPLKQKCCEDGCDCASPDMSWTNWYATQFRGADEVAVYALSNFTDFYEKTLAFRDVLTSATLPEAAVDAVTATLSVLKSPTCLRLTDGSFYGWEGCHANAGCCEGSCTHVWNYAYAMCYLFPSLERSMRDLDYRYNLKPDGGMGFRLQLPIGREPTKFRPCCDGQFGGVLKTYREWKLSGDTAWLKKLWPGVKASIEYAWSKDNPDRWDADKDGVLEGRQHHTLDMELFGPNAWLTGFYLGALKAGAEMADALGENETASEYRALFQSGKKTLDTELFNGEYYQQNVDLNNRDILRAFSTPDQAIIGGDGDVADAYWNEEVGEMKYQIGEGCGIDQVLAQWHANLIGLGEIFDREKTKAALAAIHKHNFIRRMGERFNPCRLYCIQDESGALICAYPDGRKRPVISAPYAEETMHGFEYQAAIHMIQEGMTEQGMEIVKAVRDRYDGERRNPWNEIECGSNYARSLAAFALIPAFCGFIADMTKNELTFNPPALKEGFACPFFLPQGWGVFAYSTEKVVLDVRAGTLPVDALNLPFVLAVTGVKKNTELAFTVNNGRIAFPNTAVIKAGEKLTLALG